jgi:hypothetical protein
VPSSLNLKEKVFLNFAYVVHVSPGLFIYGLQNMNNLPFVCPENIRVTTEAIIVPALVVKTPSEVPSLFGLLRALTSVDGRVWLLH